MRILRFSACHAFDYCLPLFLAGVSTGQICSMLHKTTTDIDTAGPLIRTEAINAIGIMHKKDRAELQY